MMQDETASMLGLIQQHLSWYPLMEPRDIYKLLYQGVMGSEHLISSSDDFTRHLRSEFDHLLSTPSERILEPIRPDQTLLRLNIRAYKNQHRRIDPLISPLLETARSFTGDYTKLKASWTSFIQSCEQGWIFNFSIKEIHQFNAWLEEMVYPSVHHSDTYRREYQPAYRLIAAGFISALELKDAG
jgi:hypothetical protein